MSQFSRRSLLTAGSGLSLAAAMAFARPVRAQSADMMGHPETVVGDAYSVMAAIPELTTWVQLIDAGGLQEYARAPVPYTIFPVTNSVWDAHPEYMKQLLGYQYTSGSHNDQDAFPNNTTIVQLVRSHVLRGKHYASEFEGKKVTLDTIAGSPLTIDATTSPATISWKSQATGQMIVSQLVEAPITCSNAVIYIVNNADIG